MKAFCPSIVSSKSNRKLVQRVGQASPLVSCIDHNSTKNSLLGNENSFTMNGGGYVGGFFIGVHMPPRIPRACRKRGCAGTTTDSSGYCDKHRGEGWVQHQRGLSRHQRGYGSKWDAIRARILKRDNHLCQNCLRNGRAVEARTVDHIIPKAHGGTDADSNLQSLCWPCHKAKTARERIN